MLETKEYRKRKEWKVDEKVLDEGYNKREWLIVERLAIIELLQLIFGSWVRDLFIKCKYQITYLTDRVDFLNLIA